MADQLTIPCPCCTDGFVSAQDRHARTRQDVCRNCAGTGFALARTGESIETSAPASAKASRSETGRGESREAIADRLQRAMPDLSRLDALCAAENAFPECLGPLTARPVGEDALREALTLAYVTLVSIQKDVAACQWIGDEDGPLLQIEAALANPTQPAAGQGALEPGEAEYRAQCCNWDAWEHKTEAEKRRYAALTPAPQASPSKSDGGFGDGRRICEVLGFDPANHHNALKCPYCNPDGLAFASPSKAAPARSDEFIREMNEAYFAWRDGPGGKAYGSDPWAAFQAGYAHQTSKAAPGSDDGEGR